MKLLVKPLYFFMIIFCLYSCKDIKNGITSAQMYTSIDLGHYEHDSNCVVIYMIGLKKFDCKDKHVREIVKRFDKDLFSYVKDNSSLNKYQYAILQIEKSNINKYGENFSTVLTAYRKIDLDELRKYKEYKFYERNTYNYGFSDVLESETNQYKTRILNVRTYLSK